MRFFLLLLTFLVAAILPATFAGLDSAVASTQKLTNKVIASIFTEEDVATANNLRTEEFELLGDDANGVGYLEMFEFGTSYCDESSLAHVIGVRLNTCIPVDDKKEQGFVIYGKVVGGVIYGRRQSFFDAACTQKRGYPQKATFHSGQCHDGMKMAITEGLKGNNQDRGVVTALYQKPQACLNKRWNNIIMYSGAPFGSCQDDQPDQKYTACDDNSVTSSVYASNNGQCTGPDQSNSAPKWNCFTMDGITVSQYCI